MINEANAILTHNQCQEVISAAWRQLHFWTQMECHLPSGKVADVIGFSRAGDVFIAEVKHTLKSSLIEEALSKYARWSNYLFLAVAGIVEVDLDRHIPIVGMPQAWHRVGIIGVYPATMRILRSPAYRQVGRLDKLQMETIIRLQSNSGSGPPTRKPPIAGTAELSAGEISPNRC